MSLSLSHSTLLYSTRSVGIGWQKIPSLLLLINLIINFRIFFIMRKIIIQVKVLLYILLLFFFLCLFVVVLAAPWFLFSSSSLGGLSYPTKPGHTAAPCCATRLESNLSGLELHLLKRCLELISRRVA